MLFIYNLSIKFYYFLILLFSPFKEKAKQWITGRENLFQKLKASRHPEDKIVWFHASSLGEFEQTRPVIEKYKALYPETKIFLSFFSPSGYNIRKNYSLADYVFYMPLDTRRNAKRLYDILKPEIVFFVKYDFWYHHIHEAAQRNIPIYLFSAIFREEQLFFKSYGKFFARILSFFTHIFVQDSGSYKLLEKHKYKNITVAGDTRLDRVVEIARNAKEIPEAKHFSKNAKLIVAGSTWSKDEELLCKYINEHKDYKLIIAPHEITEKNLSRIESLLKRSYCRFSNTNPGNVTDCDVLIIDNIGMLSSLYRYGVVSYVGNGFGSGIHNTLEPAVYGIPVIFGPNYHKFKEAIDLIKNKGAFSVSSYDEFDHVFTELLENDNMRNEAGKNAGNYVHNNAGACSLIIDFIK